MEYTIMKLARLAGISTRTLRFYDELGILKPARISSSGYRIYGELEVDRLQQIMFYREFGLNLEEIKKILESPAFNEKKALLEHMERLLEKREQLELMLNNVERSIEALEEGKKMKDVQKFEGFKKKLVDENEKKYGKEIRQKYGSETVDKSNAKVLGMKEEDHQRVTKLAEEVMTTLEEAFKTGNPAGELAQKVADLHRQWLCFYWDSYSKEAHAGVAQMYVEDERFTKYYDGKQPGTAQFLRDAILIYTGMDKRS